MLCADLRTVSYTCWEATVYLCAADPTDNTVRCVIDTPPGTGTPCLRAHQGILILDAGNGTQLPCPRSGLPDEVTTEFLHTGSLAPVWPYL